MYNRLNVNRLFDEKKVKRGPPEMHGNIPAVFHGGLNGYYFKMRFSIYK